jgi:hypothetical protein
MGLQPPKPLTEPEGFSTGFKVQRPENEIQFSLSRDECAQFAALLLRFIATE